VFQRDFLFHLMSRSVVYSRNRNAKVKEENKVVLRIESEKTEEMKFQFSSFLQLCRASVSLRSI